MLATGSGMKGLWKGAVIGTQRRLWESPSERSGGLQLREQPICGDRVTWKRNKHPKYFLLSRSPSESTPDGLNVTESQHRCSRAWYPSTWASWIHGAVWRRMESESGRVNNEYSPTYHRLLIIIQKQRKGMLAKNKSDPKHGKNIVYSLFKTLFLTEQILKTIELGSHRNQMQRFSRHTMISITDSL